MKNKESQPGELPNSRGNTYIKRVISIYTDLFRYTYGFYPELPIARFGKAIKKLTQTKTEMQIASLIIIFFDWKGMTGDDKFESDNLTKVTHNFGWFFSSVNKYEAYLRNIFGLELDNELKVKEFVAKNMLAIK